jgi:hypothetical protein
VSTYASGYSIRLGLLRSVVCAIVEDRGGILNARRPFYVNADLMTAVQRLDRSGNLICPNLDFIGKNWYKRFVSRHPVLSAMYWSIWWSGSGSS